MSAGAFGPIISAVAADGFTPSLHGAGIHFHGKIQVGGFPVPLCLRFEDLTLAEGPRLFLPDTAMLGRKVIPHVDESGELCAVDRRLFLFDRYKAAQHTRGLIARAVDVLTRGMTAAGTREIAEEFGAYWAGSSNIPSPSLTDPATANKNRPNEAYVTSASILSFAPHQARPTTLGELLDWASHWDEGLGPRILATLGKLSSKDPTVIVQAQNAAAAARILVSARGQKFQKALERPAGWRRFLTTAAARSLPIERGQGRRYDLAALLGANGADGRAPFVGRQIILVGCGAIGGYLARMLAQLGAGLGGRLALIDPDLLSNSNIRRHQLGAAEILREKAQASADAISRDFPGLNVIALNDDVTRRASILADADLVIDATGEQGLSDWLNQWALDRRAVGKVTPALLFVWVSGEGAAAQSLLVIDNKHACYRCLQPDPNKPGRFHPLKEAPPIPVAACGEQPSTRYGPAAPAAAASLAASHASDWAAGNPHALLRTVRIDWKSTVKRDPKSPDRAASCPACGIH